MRMIEGTRAVEAIASLGTLRSAMERCYLMNNASYIGCELRSGSNGSTFSNTLDVDNPSGAPNAHFYYTARAFPLPGYGYMLEARRNCLDGGECGLVRVIGMGFSCRVLNVGDFGISWQCDPSDQKIHWAATSPYQGSIPRE